MVRCVDDSLLHDKDVEEHWWRVITFLELAGNGRIVLNTEKFQFSQTTVDFAGFRIADENDEPLPKYLDSIRGYPTPANITDIRSWFGLVNQVSHYSQLRVFGCFKNICLCARSSPGCCEDGWHIVSAGSRFLSKTEQDYAPVEGEALGVAWALEQTRFFTMGCYDLIVVVDHAPLVKLLGDRRLDEIDNPR